MYTSNKTFIIAFFILVIAFTVLGCAAMVGINQMYSGPELPKDEIALIKPGWSAHIAAVDGKKPGFNDVLIGVKPGKHAVVVAFREYREFQVLSLECEAGHTYVAHVRWVDGIPTTWIEDAKTGRSVAIPDKLKYINYYQHIKLTFPNDKWRVYTKPNERLKKIWLTPWKENSAYHVLWAFVPDWPHSKLSMVLQINPVKGHRLRIAADTTLDEYIALIKSGLEKGKDEEIDSKVIQRNDRRIGVIAERLGGDMWLYTFFKEKDRFSFLLFICNVGLFESNKDQFWAIVDSYEYLE